MTDTFMIEVLSLIVDVIALVVLIQRNPSP